MNYISIHAPREGSDLEAPNLAVLSGQISIHAPREGSDVSCKHLLTNKTNFNPRSP